MGAAQIFCLVLMFIIGGFSFCASALWSDMTKAQRVLFIAWLAFWLGPPIYFLWTKGVMG